MTKTNSVWFRITWLLTAAALGVAAEGVPKIQFEQTVYNFGKTSQVSSVSGVFKFKNVGDGILKVEPPKPSCGCTVAELKPDTLPPGASGELPFTLNLGQVRATLEKHIEVHSNDPKTPDVGLTIQVDYTPLYDLSPMTLTPTLEFGTNEITQFATLTRTDGKPLRIARLDASKPWITASLETNATSEPALARIKVVLKRDGPPRRFNEYVHIYSTDDTNSPASSVYLYGQVKGEVSFNPEMLYWNVSQSAKSLNSTPESQVRKIVIQAAAGKKVEVKNLQSSLKNVQVELKATEPGKTFEVIARLVDSPTNAMTGRISFDTNLAAQQKIEVPIIISVFK